MLLLKSRGQLDTMDHAGRTPMAVALQQEADTTGEHSVSVNIGRLRMHCVNKESANQLLITSIHLD